MKTFIIHYAKLLERKSRLLPLLKENGLNYEFIEQYDRATLREEEAQIFSIEGHDWSHIPQPAKASMAITLSHIFCWKEIAQKYDCGLVLEDDAIFDSHFNSEMHRYMQQLPQDWDMLFLGDGCGLHIPLTEIVLGNNVYRKNLEPTPWGGDGGTRCTDSYLVSKKCAVKLMDYLQKADQKISQNIDWWLNRAMRDCDLKVYWAEPTIVTQGSQNQMYGRSWTGESPQG